MEALRNHNQVDEWKDYMKQYVSEKRGTPASREVYLAYLDASHSHTQRNKEEGIPV